MKQPAAKSVHYAVQVHVRAVCTQQTVGIAMYYTDICICMPTAITASYFSDDENSIS